MRKDLTLPCELPGHFAFTDPSGLTAAQAEEKLRSGHGNRMTDPDNLGLPRILLNHTLTLFNLLNLSLALCLLLVGYKFRL